MKKKPAPKKKVKLYFLFWIALVIVGLVAFLLNPPGTVNKTAEKISGIDNLAASLIPEIPSKAPERLELSQLPLSLEEKSGFIPVDIETLSFSSQQIFPAESGTVKEEEVILARERMIQDFIEQQTRTPIGEQKILGAVQGSVLVSETGVNPSVGQYTSQFTLKIRGTFRVVTLQESSIEAYLRSMGKDFALSSYSRKTLTVVEQDNELIGYLILSND